MFTFESNIASFYPYALKGQKLSITRQYTKLLPLQGVLLNASIPRALPWARSFCPFRAYGENLLPQGVRGKPIASGRVGNYFTSDFTLPSANLVSMMSPAFSCEAERMLLPSFSVML